MHEGIVGYSKKIKREAFAEGIGLKENMNQWKHYNFFDWLFFELYGILCAALF